VVLFPAGGKKTPRGFLR